MVQDQSLTIVFFLKCFNMTLPRGIFRALPMQESVKNDCIKNVKNHLLYLLPFQQQLEYTSSKWIKDSQQLLLKITITNMMMSSTIMKIPMANMMKTITHIKITMANVMISTTCMKITTNLYTTEHSIWAQGAQRIGPLGQVKYPCSIEAEAG